MSERVDRSVSISESEFTRILFLTRELEEFPVERLQSFGCDADELEGLLNLLRSARRMCTEHDEADRFTLVLPAHPAASDPLRTGYSADELREALDTLAD
ncbi:hypothetical protein [Streptomyces sp. ODS28]|uniref:hypothetical protein n=1 Tax=Streptomyces sp. ODS28 TaxID=3136688 RepID=UPI0031E93F43